jgi:hypothetical protein
MIISTGFGTLSVIADLSSGPAPSITQAKNLPPTAGETLPNWRPIAFISGESLWVW